MGGLLAFAGLMSPEPTTVSELPIPTIEEIIYSEEFLTTQGHQQQLDCLPKRITPSLLMRLLGEYDLSRVKAVQWGVNNEEEALKAFTKVDRETVQETGIWLDSMGILGASPDGIVDDETVLEAKLPLHRTQLNN
ncbi:hypothetical protein OS493_002667 [Desmophyllum pertusum]|uniref:YqaJ viral recombinase domain-containing protein n=1 Tax=Desmophyllum pertusum TaxID=174260 RepID=A0A9W9YTK7_9CNID|nr:hypothetical protein OS493_002667 [Desmophyllum pertusum]